MFFRRGVAVAEDSACPGYQVPFAESIPKSHRRHYHGGRSHHRGEAGEEIVASGRRHGRARPRHAVRPALGLACAAELAVTSRRRRILALATRDAKGAVRRDDVRDAVDRHCEEQRERSNPSIRAKEEWIASLSLAMTEASNLTSRTPPPRGSASRCRRATSSQPDEGEGAFAEQRLEIAQAFDVGDVEFTARL